MSESLMDQARLEQFGLAPVEEAYDSKKDNHSWLDRFYRPFNP